jgi:hypothetical protein
MVYLHVQFYNFRPLLGGKGPDAVFNLIGNLALEYFVTILGRPNYVILAMPNCL